MLNVLTKIEKICIHTQDDELDEETKSYLNSSTHDEDTFLKSPSISSKPSVNPLTVTTETAPAQQKKVVLKRKLTTSLSFTDSEGTSEQTKPTAESNKIMKLIEITPKTISVADENGESNSNGKEDGSVVKLTKLTMKERLELRAKKFGATPSTDALKQARAERFGLPAKETISSTTSNTSSISGGAVTSDVDVLKKRAERFGGSVSQTMVKMENKEKLLKRQERFGAPSSTKDTEKSTSTPALAVDTKPSPDYAEKLLKRQERFKTTV